ncbi:hypothetical protein HMPREF9069_00940 [Atopobium sp. oral taxon 810 str. F0209]|nr:hypothetical protein HMPREF9069_00940 [Atopobium sp. oral taxon 810 str. F0209]
MPFAWERIFVKISIFRPLFALRADVRHLESLLDKIFIFEMQT